MRINKPNTAQILKEEAYQCSFGVNLPGLLLPGVSSSGSGSAGAVKRALNPSIRRTDTIFEYDETPLA